MFVYSVISISTNLNVDTFSSYTTCGAWHSIFISKIRFNEKNSPEHPGFTANKPHLRDAEFNKQGLRMETERAATQNSTYDVWRNLSKAEVSKAGNFLTAEATASPSFTASSWLDA